MIELKLHLQADRMEDLVVEFRKLGWDISHGARGQGEFTEPSVLGWWTVDDITGIEPDSIRRMKRRENWSDEPGEMSYLPATGLHGKRPENDDRTS